MFDSVSTRRQERNGCHVFFASYINDQRAIEVWHFKTAITSSVTSRIADYPASLDLIVKPTVGVTMHPQYRNLKK